MKGADRLVFEGRVESDPVLKEEFDQQMDIINSLKNQRKTELKSRLSEISVEPTLIGALLQSALIKPVIYGLTSLTVVTGSYLFYNIEPATHYHIERIEGKTEYLTASRINLDIKEKLSLPRIEGQEHVVVNALIDKVDMEEAVHTSEKVAVRTQSLSFEVPELGEDQEEDFKAPALVLESPQKIELATETRVPDKISINQVNSRKYDFHYRIEDNRLFLYGEFNKSPYEIIEVNGASNKKIYFFYNGEFFHLRKGANDVTKLSSIEDQSLISKLESLKSSYTN